MEMSANNDGVCIGLSERWCRKCPYPMIDHIGKVTSAFRILYIAVWVMASRRKHIDLIDTSNNLR